MMQPTRQFAMCTHAQMIYIQARGWPHVLLHFNYAYYSIRIYSADLAGWCSIVVHLNVADGQVL